MLLPRLLSKMRSADVAHPREGSYPLSAFNVHHCLTAPDHMLQGVCHRGDNGIRMDALDQVIDQSTVPLLPYAEHDLCPRRPSSRLLDSKS